MSERERILEAAVVKAISDLGEHCDSVQIFVTAYDKEDGRSTHSYSKGDGNWYARYGQVIDWVTMQRARTELMANKEDEQE